MKTAIRLFCAVLMLCAPALADAQRYTFYQQAKITDAAIGNLGANVFLCAPNPGGTGLSAGKVMLLDDAGSVIWQHQSGDEMLRCKVAASADTRVCASISVERGAPGVQPRTMLRAWVPSAAPTPRPTYTIQLDPILDYTTHGVHVSRDGRWVVGWVHDPSVRLQIEVIDTFSTTRSSLTINAGSLAYTESQLSDNGATLYLHSISEELAVHVRPDPGSAVCNSTRFPILWDMIVNGGNVAGQGLAQATGDTHAGVAYNATFADLRITYAKRGDWNYWPEATYEWQEWFRIKTITDTAVPYPICAAVSPDGQTVAAGMISSAAGQGGLGIVDLAGLAVQPITNWPPWTGCPPIVSSAVGSMPAYVGWNDVEFVSNSTLVTVCRSRGPQPKLGVYRKVAGSWTLTHSEQVDITDQFSNQLRVSPHGRALVLSYGVASDGPLGSYLRVYEVAP